MSARLVAGTLVAVGTLLLLSACGGGASGRAAAEANTAPAAPNSPSPELASPVEKPILAAATVTSSPATATSSPSTPTNEPVAPTLAASAPDPANCWATASVSEARPLLGAKVAVSGQLRCPGDDPSGATMETTWNYRAAFATCSGTTNETGKASCSRETSGMKAGYTVSVEVRFLRAGLVVAKTHTGFTPR